MPEIEKGLFGEPLDKEHSDVENVEEIRDLIRRYAAKCVSDSFILGLAGSPRAPRSAIVFLPTIYGRGRGPVNQRSVQVPELARVTLQHRVGMYVGRGLSVWSNVHITDASQIFLKLVEKAAGGEDGSHYWNENGLYFAENGAMVGLPLSSVSWKHVLNKIVGIPRSRAVSCTGSIRLGIGWFSFFRQGDKSPGGRRAVSPWRCSLGDERTAESSSRTKIFEMVTNGIFVGKGDSADSH